MVQPSCQPYLESWAHKLLGGLGACPPQEIFELDAQICYFWHIFTINMKDILYITLKVQAAQNVSIQNDLTWKTEIFFYN